MASVIFLQNLWFEFMGPMYLSASLKSHGHDCRLLIGDSYNDFNARISATPPDIVAFSVMTGMHTWAADTARMIKKAHPGCLILLGGPHPTFFPEIIEESGIDIICRGEGECALQDLACALDSGGAICNIPNLWVKQADGSIIKNDVRPLLQDLDSLPNPDRTLYSHYHDLSDSSVKVVMSSRGCPFDCTFCFNHQMAELYRDKGRYVRHRSPESVIGEIEQLKRDFQAERIYFADDTFALDRRWLTEFLPKYGSAVGLPFHCLIRINQVDEDIARLMRENGCETVFFGIESGDETIRNEVLKKAITDREIRDGAALLKRNGITFRTYNIVGFPGETFDQALKTVRLNIEIGTDFPWCSIFMPYPGTRLAEYAKDAGFCSTDLTVDTFQSSFFITSILNNPDRNRLVNLHKFFQTVVLFPALLPLVMLLVRLPANPLFRLWFGLIYFLIYIRSEGRGLVTTFKTALRNGNFFRKR
jgi:anaerobic magnesium-protoporphyrin IX monomethyl ester cyclase